MDTHRHSGWIVLILAALIFMGLSATWLNSSRPAAAVIQPQLDPNAATWWELAELPQVGESLARRIIEYRDSQPPPPFRRLQDLRAVRGIGPATLRKIAPDLRFPPA